MLKKTLVEQAIERKMSTAQATGVTDVDGNPTYFLLTVDEDGNTIVA